LEILDKNELQVAIREHDARYGGPTVPPGQERDYLTDLAFHYARTASDKLIDLDRILSHIELDSLVSTH
jgi:hypothetical protein